jgi:hypothetical protein
MNLPSKLTNLLQIHRLTDKRNFDEFKSTYSSVPMNITIYLSMTSNQRIYLKPYICRQREQRGGGGYTFQRMKGNARTEKGEKENALFPNPAYIRRLIDEYRRTRTIRFAPPIFIGEAMLPTNIAHIFVSDPHRRIHGSDQTQIGRLIYSSVPSQN